MTTLILERFVQLLKAKFANLIPMGVWVWDISLFWMKLQILDFFGSLLIAKMTWQLFSKRESSDLMGTLLTIFPLLFGLVSMLRFLISYLILAGPLEQSTTFTPGKIPGLETSSSKTLIWTLWFKEVLTPIFWFRISCRRILGIFLLTCFFGSPICNL